MHVPKAEVPMTLEPCRLRALESWQLFKHDWNLAQPCCIFKVTGLTRSCGEEKQDSALFNNSVQSRPWLQSYRVTQSALKNQTQFPC